MIVVEFYPQEPTHKSFAYQAIFRALVDRYKNNVILWQPSQNNLYDMYDEIKPEKLIYFSPSLERGIGKLNLPTWNFEDWYKDVPLISDTSIYKPLQPNPELACETICIAPYKDIDKYNDEFFKMMDKKVKNFRYFGVHNFGGHKDCGPINDSIHSLFLSAAKNVVCLSKHFAVNAYLANTNIVNYNLTEEEVNKTLSSEIIKEIV